MEYNSAIKQNEMMAFAATWMDLQIEILNKMPDRGGKMSYVISYMQNLKKKIEMNLFTNQKQTHRLKEQTYICQEGRDSLGIPNDDLKT